MVASTLAVAYSIAVAVRSRMRNGTTNYSLVTLGCLVEGLGFRT